MQRSPNYWQFLMGCFVWANAGALGRLGRIALFIGLGLGVFQYALPNLSITPSTNGLVRGIVPLAVSASVFVIRLFLAPYFLWRNARREVVRLEESLEPKLRVWYDITRFPGCKRVNYVVPQIQEVFRLAVETSGVATVKGCKGILSEITFVGDSEPVFVGNNVDLAFAPNDREDTTSKTINKGTPEFLDLLFLHFRHHSLVGILMGTPKHEWPAHFDQPTVMFRRPGVYYLKINIVSESPPVPVQLKLTISDTEGQSVAELVPP